MEDRQLSQLAASLISAFEKQDELSNERKISVNPVVSKFASWYEKVRNVMDYREEEVILRAAIERILKRRLLWGEKGQAIATPLVRELVWARYFQNESLPESIVEKVSERIILYLKLREAVVATHKLDVTIINQWIYHIASADIERMLHPNKTKEVMCNFMYQIMRDQISFTDTDEQTRDVQVFIAVRRSFARDDIAFLRYHLFTQFFGKLTAENVEHIATNFLAGYTEISKQLTMPRKDRIYTYVRNRTALFFILDDLIHGYKGSIRELIKNEDEFKQAVFSACEARYKGIRVKVQTAIIRSVFFILFTKVFFAFAVEGTIEKLLYGEIMWNAIVINTTVPPLLMIIVGLLIETPGKDNSERIFALIKRVLFEQHPEIGNPMRMNINPDKKGSFLFTIFTTLWFLGFIITFGAIIFILTKIGLHYVSQAIFLFFIAIVSFLSYRIAIIPKTYLVLPRQGVLTPVIDLFFMPAIRVGRSLTEGISQINVFLFLFDLIIETPFKGLFAFFEQWFLFLHAKREDLG